MCSQRRYSSGNRDGYGTKLSIVIHIYVQITVLRAHCTHRCPFLYIVDIALGGWCMGWCMDEFIGMHGQGYGRAGDTAGVK